MADHNKSGVIRAEAARMSVAATPDQQFGSSSPFLRNAVCIVGGSIVQASKLRKSVSFPEVRMTSLDSFYSVGSITGLRSDDAREAPPFDVGAWWTEDGIAGRGIARAAHRDLSGRANTRATLDEDGGVTICSAVHNSGHGTCCIITQIAADRLGLPTDRVRVHLSDNRHLQSLLTADFQIVSAPYFAIEKTCVALMSAIARRAIEDLASPLFGMPLERLRVGAGRITLDRFGGRAEGWSDLAARWEDDPVTADLI